MAYFRSFFCLVLVILGLSLGQCAEFVPVFMWGTNKMTEHVPALHKISQDSFKDSILEFMKKNPYIVVFAERTLSPEDFAQRNQNGESAFVNIQQLKNDGNFVSYRPYVQNPIGAIKQVNKPITEISIESILSTTNVPENNIWIINLNDAKDGESRFHMLKRHDNDIVAIYKDILKKRENVLVIYTASHTAWVASEDLHTRSRNLLEEEEKKPKAALFNNSNVLMYLTDSGSFSDGKKQIVIDDKATFNVENRFENNITAILSSGGETIKFVLSRKESGYWFINKISAGSVEFNGVEDMYAPNGFSYHCSGFNLTDKEKTSRLILPGFQIQWFSNSNNASMKFGDAYDCVGFTSVPIWSGLFITAILLLIITFGLTMMMDIKTMDRFDDPKGKTITVTASE